MMWGAIIIIGILAVIIIPEIVDWILVFREKKEDK